MKQFFKVAGVILLFIVVGVVVASFASYDREQTAKVRENDETIQNLTAQLDALSDGSTETVDAVQTRLASAADAGIAVAQMQNAYIGASETDIESLAAGMDKYLASDSQNACVAWYAYDINDIAYAWTFESTYSFDSNEIPVVWTCRTDDNVLLAYATAIYDADVETFKEVAYHMTTKGASVIPAD